LGEGRKKKIRRFSERENEREPSRGWRSTFNGGKELGGRAGKFWGRGSFEEKRRLKIRAKR